MDAGIADRFDLAVDPAVAEPTGDEDAAYIGEDLICVFRSYFFRIHPFDVYRCVGIDPTVFQRFHDTDIGIVELDVFPYKGDRHFLRRMFQLVNHLSPVFQVRFRAVQMEALADNLRQTFLFHCERSFVQVFHIEVLEHMACGKVAEQGNLVLHVRGQRILGAAYDDIRLDAHALEFFYACLGRFRLHLL